MREIIYNSKTHCFYETDYEGGYSHLPDFNEHFPEFKTILLRYINAHLDFALFGQERSKLVLGWYANENLVTAVYPYYVIERFIEFPWDFVKKYIEPEVTKIYGLEW